MEAQRPRPYFSKLILKILQWLPVRLSLAALLSLVAVHALPAQTVAPALASSTAQATSPSGDADNGDWVHQSLGQHAIQLGLLAGAGTGLGHSGGNQFLFRLGSLILTVNHH